jgi:hypothetical protein
VIPAPGSTWTPPPPSGHSRRHSQSPHVACSFKERGTSSVFVTCNISSDASKSLRKQKIAVLLHKNGKLAASATGHFGKRIRLDAKLHGRYTLAVDFAGNVKVVRSIRVA